MSNYKTMVENLKPFADSEVYEIRDLFKGTITMGSLFRKLKKWGDENLKHDKEVVIRAYTFYKSGSGRYSRIRGLSAWYLADLLVKKFPDCFVVYGNDAPRRGKLGDYVMFAYRPMVAALENYLKETSPRLISLAAYAIKDLREEN